MGEGDRKKGIEISPTDFGNLLETAVSRMPSRRESGQHPTREEFQQMERRLDERMGMMGESLRQLADSMTDLVGVQHQIVAISKQAADTAGALERHVEATSRAMLRQERETSAAIIKASKPGIEARDRLEKWAHRLWLPSIILIGVGTAAGGIVTGIAKDAVQDRIQHTARPASGP